MIMRGVSKAYKNFAVRQGDLNWPLNYIPLMGEELLM
jgi:hypothetical protein